MPQKKRTNHSKATPPSSPTTSTSHSHTDHLHQPLRDHGTGPTIGTRARASSNPSPASKRTPTSHLKDTIVEEQGKKDETEFKPTVTPPVGGSKKFAKSVYILTSIAVLLLVWYAYGMVTLLARLKNEVGWWGVVVGRDSPMAASRSRRGWEGFSPLWGSSSGGGGGRADVEGSLNALADALGLDPVEVASAVRPLVPRASMASKSGRTGESEAMRVLFEDGGGHDAMTVAQEFAGHSAEGEVLD